MRVRLLCLLPALAMLCCTTAAEAHFLWIGVEPNAAGKPVAQLWFGEAATAGEAELIKNVAKTKVWINTSGERKPVAALQEVQNKDAHTAALTSAVDDAGWQSVEGICEYGVITRGDKPFLLNYYAKHLRPGSAKELETRAAGDALPLAIVPVIDGDSLRVRALWRGKPAPNIQVIVHHSADEADEFTSDAQGEITFKPTSKGLLGIRARLIEENKGGELAGQKYQEVRHYSTLTLLLPGSKASTAQTTAAGLLEQASAARAVWHDFPGFTADLAIHTDGAHRDCRVIVSPDGEVELTGSDVKADQAVLRTIHSLVAHRLAGPEPRDGATFADEQHDHPLGRLIKLNSDGQTGDDQMGSAFRVRGDVLTEVNRTSADSRFTISVIDVSRNAEGKHLPHVYTVSYWDAKTGALKTTSTSFNHWTQVGKFDLPAMVTTVRAQQNGTQVTRLEFTGHQLLPAGASVVAP